MRVLGDDQQRLVGLPHVPKLGLAVVTAAGDHVLLVRIKVQVSNQLGVRVLHRPRRLHRSQVPSSNVVVVGGGDGGRVVVRIPLAGRQFGAGIEMAFTAAAFLVDGGGADDGGDAPDVAGNGYVVQDDAVVHQRYALVLAGGMPQRRGGTEAVRTSVEVHQF